MKKVLVFLERFRMPPSCIRQIHRVIKLSRNRKEKMVNQSEPTSSFELAPPRQLEGQDTIQLELSDDYNSPKRGITAHYELSPQTRLLIHAFLCVVSWILYVSSVETCLYKDDYLCYWLVVLENVKSWLIYIFFSALITTWVIFRGPKPVIAIHALVMTYLCYFYDMNLSSKAYGLAISVLYQVFFGLIILTVLMVKRIMRLSSLRRKVLAFISIGLVSLVAFQLNSACGNWDRGLKGVRIANDQSCRVIYPRFCAYEYLSGVLNITRFVEPKGLTRDPKILTEFYPSGNFVGFPRTEFFSRSVRNDVDLLTNTVYKNFAVFNTYEEATKSDSEFFLNKTVLEESEIVIRVKRREDIVAQRAKIAASSTSLAKNVIVLMIDTLSRAHFYRALPKTARWFEKYYRTSEEKRKNSADPETFQFMKYHATGDVTNHNIYPALFGSQAQWNITNTPYAEKKVPMVDYFQKAGFITGYSHTDCKIRNYDWSFNIKDVAYDHEGILFACDPHYLLANNRIDYFQGPNSIVRRMIYGKDAFEYSLEYLNQFWKVYANEKKMFYIDFEDNHELTQETIKFVDEGLSQFLMRLDAQGVFKDTALVLFSDHGNHNPFIYNMFQQWYIEQSFPLLLIVLPEPLSKRYGDSLKMYEQSFTTHYELYYTFLSLANGGEEHNEDFELSLFSPLLTKLTCYQVPIMRIVHKTHCFCV